ncbi:MAG: cellulase family glycosylhydrolase [Muribaculaceae bacterium]
MRLFSAIFLASGLMLPTLAVASTDSYNVYVDRDGVMRRDDTKEEVSFYGTNYTVPFAHAYRALGSLGIDRKSAIDRDVYHMARLGFNGFRLHLWDVELSDSLGNLVENDHLDLLDYLLAQLEKRGIKTVITAQTNFGNGYPERNTDPNGAFTYDYEKCKVHDDPAAIKAQERYIGQLLSHRNPYTGKTYAADPELIAVEINNEPCHSGTEKEVKAYVNRMVRAIRRAGWKKPVLYNVSHNYDVTQAFYDADIDGTTYQWYPVNLVAGHARKGNFLPYVDQYDIPFADKVKGFGSKARVVYEFDPADNLYSYLFPAISRTFRKEGFQWMTQFAYDPTDMAWSNSEYQTHYLNLAYTPQKALAMMIAAEAARTVKRGADYGKYPVDTVFGDFMVSARQDLSMLNDGKKFYYTGDNAIRPKDMAALEHVAGRHSSPVVNYEGEGAYFLDRISPDVWRLEVMPDVVLTSDPFAKPSLSKRVGEILYRDNAMSIDIPALGKQYYFKGINDGNSRSGEARDGKISVYPGVYLLSSDKAALSSFKPDDRLGNMALGEFAAPAPREVTPVLVHEAVKAVERGGTLTIHADVASSEVPDSVVLYPGTVSFWNERNKLYPMARVSPYGYEVTVDSVGVDGASRFDYMIAVFGKDGSVKTWPSLAAGTPLDWDYLGDDAPAETRRYETPIVEPRSAVVLLDATVGTDGVELSSIPTDWGGTDFGWRHLAPKGENVIGLRLDRRDNNRRVILSKYVADIMSPRTVSPMARLHLSLGDVNDEGVDSVTVAVINRDGFTYAATVPLREGVFEVSPSGMTLANTLLSPEPYPVFLSREFVPDPATATPLSFGDIERVQLIFRQPSGTSADVGIKGVWIE